MAFIVKWEALMGMRWLPVEYPGRKHDWHWGEGGGKRQYTFLNNIKPHTGILSLGSCQQLWLRWVEIWGWGVDMKYCGELRGTQFLKVHGGNLFWYSIQKMHINIMAWPRTMGGREKSFFAFKGGTKIFYEFKGGMDSFTFTEHFTPPL